LKKAGNEVMALLGGREIHPINVRVGGFYKLPAKRELLGLAEALKRARDEALETVRWSATLDFPDFEQDYEFVALRHANEYPFNEGRIASNKGLDIALGEFDEHVIEEQAPYSNALHSTLKGRGAYLAGPMARYNLNFDKLSPLTQEAAREAGLSSECRNPFRSIIVRSVEVLYACDEALRIIDEYEAPDRAAAEIVPRAGVGYGCTEAPRGLLYHRYRIDEQGLIADAKIVPPTSQNQKRIEIDLRQFVSGSLDLPKEQLTWNCEQAVRNYDPCISCATHFLRLEIERE
jgi:coenzyme F420-reducing hydrogenase alpha subunit